MNREAIPASLAYRLLLFLLHMHLFPCCMHIFYHVVMVHFTSTFLYIYLHLIPINIFPLIMSVRLGMRCNAIFFSFSFSPLIIIHFSRNTRDLWCVEAIWGLIFPATQSQILYSLDRARTCAKKQKIS